MYTLNAISTGFKGILTTILFLYYLTTYLVHERYIKVFSSSKVAEVSIVILKTFPSIFQFSSSLNSRPERKLSEYGIAPNGIDGWIQF